MPHDPAGSPTSARTAPVSAPGSSPEARIDHGLAAITAASLQSPAGTAAATGNIDIPDQDISASFTLTPAVPTPPAIGLTIDGNWSTPAQICAIREALAWTSAH